MKENENDKNVIEHLRMLQGIINRMASTSLNIKRYAIMIFTFACSFLIINIDANKFHMFLLAVFIFTMMILFDMYYLSMEKAYRTKYDNDRIHIEASDLFDLTISKVKFKVYVKTIVSKSIYLFYLPLLLVMIAIFINYNC